MKLHEHQAKAYLAGCGVRIPRGRVARTPDEARRAAAEIGGPVMIKAQIHAGGRGKAGGILRAASSTEVEPLARRLLGQRLVTSQTGPEGRLVRAVLIEEACQVDREYYLGLAVDRMNEAVVLMVSPLDGTEIETYDTGLGGSSLNGIDVISTATEDTILLTNTAGNDDPTNDAPGVGMSSLEKVVIALQ